jgi:hypothetical protein
MIKYRVDVDIGDACTDIVLPGDHGARLTMTIV